MRRNLLIGLSAAIGLVLLPLAINVATSDDVASELDAVKGYAWVAVLALTATSIMLAVHAQRNRAQQPSGTVRLPTKYRQRAITRVGSLVTERLSRSFYHVVRARLEFEHRPSAVAPSQAWHVRDFVDPHRPVASTISQIFTQYDQSVLVLGAPGAGKTTMLLELSAELVARAAVSGDAPIPILLDLGDWDLARRWSWLDMPAAPISREGHGEGRNSSHSGVDQLPRKNRSQSARLAAPRRWFGVLARSSARPAQSTQEDLDARILATVESRRQQKFEKWLFRTIRDRYGIGSRVAAAWIEQRQMALLLDGLDEMPPERREILVDLLNRLVREHPLLQVAIACRTDQYEGLGRRLGLQGAIEIQPITARFLAAYLADGGERLANLRAAMTKDPTLAQLATSPLWLNIMALASVHHDGKASEGNGSIAGRRREVLRIFSIEMLSWRESTRGYSSAQCIGWLGVTARCCRLKEGVATIAPFRKSSFTAWAAELPIAARSAIARFTSPLAAILTCLGYLLGILHANGASAAGMTSIGVAAAVGLCSTIVGASIPVHQDASAMKRAIGAGLAAGACLAPLAYGVAILTSPIQQRVDTQEGRLVNAAVLIVLPLALYISKIRERTAIVDVLFAAMICAGMVTTFLSPSAAPGVISGALLGALIAAPISVVAASISVPNENEGERFDNLAFLVGAILTFGSLTLVLLLGFVTMAVPTMAVSTTVATTTGFLVGLRLWCTVLPRGGPRIALSLFGIFPWRTTPFLRDMVECGLLVKRELGFRFVHAVVADFYAEIPGDPIDAQPRQAVRSDLLSRESSPAPANTE